MTIFSKNGFRRSGAILCVASAFLLYLGEAGAMGLQDVTLPAITPLNQRIPIDGKLDQWKSVPGYTCAPLAALAASGGVPAIEALLNDPVSASIKTCYDSDALYVAVEFKDRNPGTNRSLPGNADHWFNGGEGFEIHLLTDRVLHLACWPSPDGRRLSVMARYGNQAWKDFSQLVAAAGAPASGGNGYVIEARIPWKLITAGGDLPADGKVELGADFAWNAIPPDLLMSIRRAQLAGGGAQGVSVNFVTARPNLVTAGYLSNPADWGEFVFGGTATGGDQSVTSANGTTSLASLPLAMPQTPPEINGNLLDWDASQFQTSGYIQALWPDRFVSRIFARYDNENLYLAAHFSSFGPMTNLMPESTQQGFNGGDALQIRLSDGVKKINLCGWYDSASRQAALTADQKELPSPFLLQQGATEVFSVDSNLHGYLQELAIPWKLLFGQAPKNGGTIKGTFQLWYADMTPRFSIHAKMSLQRLGAIAVGYKMPADGQLTLGLFDKNGSLLKWLVQDEFRYSGENHQPWDGLDQWGNPVSSGDYVLKGIYHPPVSIDYQASVCNPGNPPWPTADGKGDWLGDESDPQSAVTDGKWVYLASPGCEKGWSIIGVDETGQRQWGFREEMSPRCVSLALHGDYLYALYSGPESNGKGTHFVGDNAVDRAVLICLDKKTGQPALFTLKTPKLTVESGPYRGEPVPLWQLRNDKSFSPFNFSGQPRYSEKDIGETTNAIGLAAAGDKLYVSLMYDGKLMELDAATGQPTGVEIPLKQPAGLYTLDDHTLLAVSGTQIVKVDLPSKTVTPLITSNLVAPDSISTDKAGNIYVSDWGSSFQVKVFDPAGKFLHAVGEEGGRPWVGKWDTNGMLVPRGLAVTDEGKLWVMEDDGSPKRISVWDAKSGSFLKEYIGPTPYGGCTYFWMDPKDATLVHAEGATFKVDYDKKTYKPLAIDYRRQNRDDPFTPTGHTGEYKAVRTLYRDGHEYQIIDNANEGSMLVVLERFGDIYKPVAAIGAVPRDPSTPFLDADGTQTQEFDSDIGGHHFYAHFLPECFAGHSGEDYSWTDLNGDHLVQPNEVHFAKTDHNDNLGAFHIGWGPGFSDGWSYFNTASLHGNEVIFRLDPRGWTPDGAPIYDPADAKAIVNAPRGSNIQGLYVTHDNKLIASASYEYGKNPDAMVCYDLDGHKLWSVVRPKEWWDREPSRAQYKQVQASNAVYDFDLPKLGHVALTWAWHGSVRPDLITSDGLYVGSLGEDVLLGPKALVGEAMSWGYQGLDGTPWFINGGFSTDHLFKINGLTGDSIGRFDGAFQLADADVKKAAAMREIPEAKAPPKPLIGVTWLNQPPAIDGSLSGWNMNTGVVMEGENGQRAEVALGRDATNLYMAWKVHEANPMRNGGADWQSLFITGDAVDLMLQSDPKADVHRQAAAAGDERVVFSMFQGKPVAVLYRPVSPGSSSPGLLSTAHFDEIRKLDSARVSIVRGKGYYTVEASVPLRDLGIDPQQTGDIYGDVGVIFADESGQSRSQRLYYYNRHTEMVNDLPTESRLQPSEWGTIAMPLGPNLLQNGGFEDPLVDSASGSGWFVSDVRNGSDAGISSEAAYTGLHSLLMETTVPMIVDPKGYAEPDYGNFHNYVNGGKGEAIVAVSQKVAVTPGHLYSMRFHYRTEDLQGEQRRPMKPRGFVFFGSQINWSCEAPHKGSIINTGGDSNSKPDWQTLLNFQGWTVPQPYPAPEGAVSATVIFRLRTFAEGHLPKVFIDDVEFVDVTPGTAAAPRSAQN